jgi:hypothetical protein
VQCRLVSQRTGQQRGTVRLVSHAQILEPFGPAAVQVPSDPDLVDLARCGALAILFAAGVAGRITGRITDDRCLSTVFHLVALLTIESCYLLASVYQHTGGGVTPQKMVLGVYFGWPGKNKRPIASLC